MGRAYPVDLRQRVVAAVGVPQRGSCRPESICVGATAKILAVSVFGHGNPRAKPGPLSMQKLWRHSLPFGPGPTSLDGIRSVFYDLDRPWEPAWEFWTAAEVRGRPPPSWNVRRSPGSRRSCRRAEATQRAWGRIRQRWPACADRLQGRRLRGPDPAPTKSRLWSRD